MKRLKEGFEERIGITPKTSFVNAILMTGTLIWGFYFVHLIGGLSDDKILLVQSINLVGIVISALVGTSVIYRVRKRVFFLKCWMLGGILISLVPMVLDVSNFSTAIVYFTSAGIYFGLSLPVAFGYFAASTETQNRSRVGGIIFLVSLLGIFLFYSFVNFHQIALNGLALAAFETVILLLTIGSKPQEREILQSDFVSYRQVFRDRSFLLYLIPWVMFTVVDFMALPLIGKIAPPNYFLMVELSGTLLAGILASVFGFLADRIGRKRLVLMGFALLGLGYASLSIIQNTASPWLEFGWSFFALVDGLSWGMFCTVLIMTIWGDLSQGRSSERYYAVGFLPFLLSSALPRTNTIIPALIPTTAVFSFASVFLFVAVLPLAYAPETLNIRDREFKSYVDKALKKKLGSDLIN